VKRIFIYAMLAVFLFVGVAIALTPTPRATSDGNLIPEYWWQDAASYMETRDSLWARWTVANDTVHSFTQLTVATMINTTVDSITGRSYIAGRLIANGDVTLGESAGDTTDVYLLFVRGTNILTYIKDTANAVRGDVSDSIQAHIADSIAELRGNMSDTGDVVRGEIRDTAVTVWNDSVSTLAALWQSDISDSIAAIDTVPFADASFWADSAALARLSYKSNDLDTLLMPKLQTWMTNNIPLGPTGATGATGPTGDPGATGPTGVMGVFASGFLIESPNDSTLDFISGNADSAEAIFTADSFWIGMKGGTGLWIK
jgi:hypothetical protein